MKKVLFVLILVFPAVSFAWGPYGPWGPGYWGGYGLGWGGYPYGAYGAMGYGWGIQAPSFNYTTVVQQSPPIIINSQPPVIYQNGCDEECERVKRYTRK